MPIFQYANILNILNKDILYRTGYNEFRLFNIKHLTGKTDSYSDDLLFVGIELDKDNIKSVDIMLLSMLNIITYYINTTKYKWK